MGKRRKSKNSTGKKLLGNIIVGIVISLVGFGFIKFYEASQTCGNFVGCLGCGGLGGTVILIVVLVREYLRM